MIPPSAWTEKTAVVHDSHGRGQVILDRGETVIVRFDDGIHECVRGELRVVPSAETAKWSPPLPVVVHALALAIRSVNERWGVFARSRIDLLPHQLWVCKRVLEGWPTRWLVADDVGLGKTVEAGLILLPLLASGRIRRLLVLAPASLVEQWQTRLREMFDIRLAIYTSAADTAKGDFWGTHPMVVASAHTLRMDQGERWERLLEADPWDMVMVDEAHHLNADERGMSLAFQLVAKLQERRRIQSMLFFTGTPHRGKNHGFFSLLKLLRPDWFDPRHPPEEQYARLRDVMIRNNKQIVTDMAGKQLFTPIVNHREVFSYNPEEAAFYEKLTRFISEGRAYASTMGQQDERSAILVLIAMQKLASSSIAAVVRALRSRLARLKARNEARPSEEKLRNAADRLAELRQRDDPSEADERAALEERLAGYAVDLMLLPNEIAAIEELLAVASMVKRETKVERLKDLIETSLEGQQVLLFTEYKATQALVVSALLERFGEGCATFINGDGYLEEVRTAAGGTTLQSKRADAAKAFNEGKVRFLVSTEAAGEGIDLQERCSALIHVDLPWNPMRMHQRVGRLSRYGQREPVHVFNLRNPDTLESRIWECLEQKLQRISQAFTRAMDDPEDMLQLVLGMSPPGFFEQLFADAPRAVSREKLSSWFDARTAEFGGEPAVRVVEEMVGAVSKFDFGRTVAEIPQVDLPDLIPFMKGLLILEGRRPEQEGNRLTFLTPDGWRKEDWKLEARYTGLAFERLRTRTKDNVAGVGHIVVNRALEVGERLEHARTRVPGLESTVVIMAVRDRVTDASGVVRKVVFGVQVKPDGPAVLEDWELIKSLNLLLERPVALARTQSSDSLAGSESADVESLHRWFDQHLPKERLPFRAPESELIAVLIPSA